VSLVGGTELTASDRSRWDFLALTGEVGSLYKIPRFPTKMVF
jgi:hypothetical protein